MKEPRHTECACYSCFYCLILVLSTFTSVRARAGTIIVSVAALPRGFLVTGSI